MTIDATKYRQVLGHFPTGVTVVSGIDGDGPIGLTIGSFTSVSLDPPLVGFLPMVTSDRWQRIHTSGSFCVNVFGASHGELCWRFAKSSIDQPFDGVAWTPAPESGAPIIDGVIAWMDCTIHQVVPAGDHHFVMGEIRALEHADASTEPVPLLFYRGGLGSFSPLAG